MSARKAYLTIDDSPSARTDDLVDFLHARGVPALLFVRGDALEKNPEAVVRALQKGFLIGNHTYSHKRVSEMDFEDICADILKCEALIEQAYKAAGMARTHKTFRFSYLDRGAGPWVLDFEAFAGAERKILEDLFWEGLNFCDRQKPPLALIEKKARLQAFLRDEGFTVPFKDTILEHLVNLGPQTPLDCFFTYSTNDWMLTQRHLAKNWPCKTLADLTRRIDSDSLLAHKTGTHVILAHDQAEIFEPVCALVDIFLQKGFEFLDF